ncbi:MBL fold metallo-hydrolase [Candidatus Aerophobetes bacterium]|nr:MBL fold metallo-hydrolase [Candidatus Aerophobetes bacterium]
MKEGIMTVKITWLGHASFKVEEKSRVYIDPWKIKETEKADLVLITHSHYDHLSPEDVEKIQGERTSIVVPYDGVGKLRGNVRGIAPGESISVNDVNIQAVPAYNVGKSYHPKGNKWVGYVVEIGGISIYHAGDTDFIPEMKEINPYVALLPIGGTYTMGVDDALRAVESLNPHIVIPMHYGDIVGSINDARRFAKSCKKAEVKILSPGEILEVTK